MPSLLTNAHFYRDGAWDPRVSAMAVRDGRIALLGSLAECREAAGSGAEEIDLGGQWVLPGFQDAHVHPVGGGLELQRCNLAESRSAADYLATIGAYAAAHPGAEWILGGGWYMEAFPGGVPTAATLDTVVADRPVFLPNRDHHSAWVNSEALRRAGITATTPDPPDGRIERDADGNPTGCLHEGAMERMAALVPPTSQAELDQGLRTGQAYLHSLGITGWQDAIVGLGAGLPDALDAYCRAAADGTLTARVVGALWWDRTRGAEQLPDLLERRARGVAAGFQATTVKIMQDGVCETFTAAMLDPYRDEHGHATDNRGVSFIEADDLARYVTLLDAHDFQVHLHALGDRAVRDSLDAIEEAIMANGARDNRHHLAHLQVVHPDDVGRFARLGATANAQPLWACHDQQMVELTIPFLSAEAVAHQYPFASLLDAGARLACGSDWPVSSPEPFAQLHVAVNRTVPPGESDDYAPGRAPLLAHEAISVTAAIDGFTAGSAYVNHLDDAGRLEVGYLADVTVADGDVLGDPAGLSSIRAALTMVGGGVVWAR
ncbi:amidohydrolase [Jatrophihabitans sp.]|uniref:amidohydrolase n=1 Tax=Jatrophihabitans sp. TaxID=1932789 RepID=UPI0030C72F3A